jgi:hypothetical protein
MDPFYKEFNSPRTTVQEGMIAISFIPALPLIILSRREQSFLHFVFYKLQVRFFSKTCYQVLKNFCYSTRTSTSINECPCIPARTKVDLNYSRYEATRVKFIYLMTHHFLFPFPVLRQKFNYFNGGLWQWRNVQESISSFCPLRGWR